jgi:hypothetical protein
MTRLPAAGRPGRVPSWPLVADVKLTAARDSAKAAVADLTDQLDYQRETGAKPAAIAATLRKLDTAATKLNVLNATLRQQRKLEASTWRELWHTPQAVEWDRLGWTREVAMYVRHRVLGELGDLEQAKEARAWSDRLGLTPMAMLKLRWAVADAGEDTTSAGRQRARATAKRSGTVYGGLRVVDPAAASQ